MKYDTAAHGQSVDLSAMNELVSAAMPSYLLQDVIDPWASGTFSSDGRSFHQARFGPPPRAHSFIYAARLTLSRRRQEGEEAVEAEVEELEEVVELEDAKQVAEVSPGFVPGVRPDGNPAVGAPRPTKLPAKL